MINTFCIFNITYNDVKKNLIRIRVDYKRFFPGSDNIEPKIYQIKVKIGSEIYDASYRVEKKRSGRLSIGSEVYKHKLGIKFGDILEVYILQENKLYEIRNGITIYKLIR